MAAEPAAEAAGGASSECCEMSSSDLVSFVAITGDAVLDCATYRSKLDEPPNRPGLCGAVATFEGLTRDDFQGKKVLRLEYEAYAPMAARVMLRICEQAREKWPSLKKLVAAHRTGHVPSGSASIFIGAMSPHRGDAMDAVRYLIDTMKEEVPVWKKERYDDGSGAWKENPDCKAPGKRWAASSAAADDDNRDGREVRLRKE
ncbi:molybdopterin synthase catalytic subunit [Pycnococcus provasolii]|uniref:Molybdopterin synthase catalytic subunit n=1 Tax=Pycnococcus provasolii TaxID=41880 RepID=A0A830HVW6_9CHLO|nr:molybdopterin synthase catalytic subunit [Pycnococcus provasolii]|mmetsp:Transcript_8650/g.19682  ORF Transcript_8650/g.19682 Transcript_8650/m.19682 type:complete len:202 (+) Transcript_8650:58-663(+)